MKSCINLQFHFHTPAVSRVILFLVNMFYRTFFLLNISWKEEAKNMKGTTSEKIWLKNANASGNFFQTGNGRGESQPHISLVDKSIFRRKISWNQRRIKVKRTLLQKGLDWKMLRTRWETFPKPKTNGPSQPHISRVNCTLHQLLS